MTRVPAVLVHGALRSRVGLWPTAWMLRRHGVDGRPFGYATRTAMLSDHGQRLGTFVEQVTGGGRPSVLGFVTHSMGGLVVRSYLGGLTELPADRVRVVMLSPPNQGASLAGVFRGFGPFHWLYGQAAHELQSERVKALPALPDGVEVLVLGGGRGDPRGFNPRLEGDDDGVVAVSDMPLGDHAFELVGGTHSRLQWRGDVLQRAAMFLRGE